MTVAMPVAFISESGSLRNTMPAATESTGIKYIVTATLEAGRYFKLQYHTLTGPGSVTGS